MDFFVQRDHLYALTLSAYSAGHTLGYLLRIQDSAAFTETDFHYLPPSALEYAFHAESQAEECIFLSIAPFSPILHP